MEDTLVYMQSRPLIGFQMDGSHLNNVLLEVIRQQNLLVEGQRQLNSRVSDVEQDMKGIEVHVREMMRVMADIGGGDVFSQIHGRLENLENAVDAVAKNIDLTKKVATSAEHDADQAGRLADQAYRAIPTLQEAVNRVVADLDSFGRRQAHETREMQRAFDGLQQSRTEQERRMDEALRDIQMRAERLAKENGMERLRELLEELSDRTDENFKSVEESARAVDGELSRQASEISSMRAVVATIEERARSQIVGLSKDVEERYQALLNAFREYEKNSHELEEHLVMAGQALARRREGGFARRR